MKNGGSVTGCSQKEGGTVLFPKPQVFTYKIQDLPSPPKKKIDYQNSPLIAQFTPLRFDGKPDLSGQCSARQKTLVQNSLKPPWCFQRISQVTRRSQAKCPGPSPAGTGRRLLEKSSDPAWCTCERRLVHVNAVLRGGTSC